MKHATLLRRTRFALFSILLTFTFASATLAGTIGPARGALVIVGGGKVGPEITQKFIELAGGPDAPMVFIPTAEDGTPKIQKGEDTFLYKAGVKHVTVLHTRDPKVADTEEFVKPLLTARAVWFEGGRQWRLVDSYLNTRVQKELNNLLARGGVIGGSSAGATIQGSYLVRGAKEGNTVMMARGYEKGLGFLHDAAVDQHVITRHRENDLDQVIAKYPKLLGIGIDESTAIVVQGNQFDVIGKSKVFIHSAKYKPAADGKKYFLLSTGDRFDLKKRKKIDSVS
jgi:cyanophycinase